MSTPRGRSGVAIIRVSGPGAFKAYECFGVSVPRDRRPVCSWIFDPDSGDPIDQALILKFGGPASYTGENTVEFQLHGSPAVIDAVLEILSKTDGFRPAEAG
ncbi:MAG: tRNA uridine-5-carboxymethylaminomethyl(34) synthesis GTPase MnmE, partial [Desulfobulbia bacterium]